MKISNEIPEMDYSNFPPTPEEQAEHVHKIYLFLKSKEAENYPAYDGMEALWEMISDDYVPERGIEAAEIAENPLAVMFYYIDMGMYPPPEIMFALHALWRGHVAYRGRISLDAVFLGKGKQKKGGYAKQSEEFLDRFKIENRLFLLTQSGKSRIEAAEIILEEMPWLEIEPESLARRYKPISRFMLKKQD